MVEAISIDVVGFWVIKVGNGVLTGFRATYKFNYPMKQLFGTG